jgi:glutathione peroxidase
MMRAVAAGTPVLPTSILPSSGNPTVLDRIALLTVMAAGLLSIARAVHADEPAPKPTSALDSRVKDIDGKNVNLSKYKGEVLLIVNTASQCGYTPQYQGLEAIYEKYKAKGFKVLAFPANEFGHQEPGSDAEIKEFCTSKYNVTFPLFAKIVVDGKGIHPLYAFLTSPETDPKFAGPIPWNFTKFLIDRKGNVIDRFQHDDEPEAEKITRAIEAALAQPK